MSRPALGATHIWWLAALLACAALTACKPREIPVACTPLPIVDGFETAMTEGGKMRLRVPAHASDITGDCKHIRLVELDYFWHKGELVKRTVDNQYDTGSTGVASNHVIKIYLRSFMLVSEVAPITVKPWQFEGALRHYKYPLEFYPKFLWAGPDKAPTQAPPDVTWGVIGTRSPIGGYPFTTRCTIARGPNEPQAAVVNGEFAKDFGDSSCRGGITAIKGDKAIFGLIDVWADNAHDIDKIYNAAIAKIPTYIQE